MSIWDGVVLFFTYYFNFLNFPNDVFRIFILSRKIFILIKFFIVVFKNLI